MNDDGRPDLRERGFSRIEAEEAGVRGAAEWLERAIAALGAWSEAVAPGEAASSLRNIATLINFRKRYPDCERAREQTERMARDFIDGLNVLRSLAWRDHLAAHPLGERKWSDFGRPVFEVDGAWIQEKVARRVQPFGLAEATLLLRRSASGPFGETGPPRATVAALARALGRAGERIRGDFLEHLPPGLRVLEETWVPGLWGRVDRLRPDDQVPAPEHLAACVRELFHPPDPVVARGCCAGDARVRLFRQYPILFEEEVPPDRFERAREAADWLAEAFPNARARGDGGGRGGRTSPSLWETYTRLVDLGDLADCLLPFLPQEVPEPRNREWARRLLENLHRLGRVAAVLRDSAAGSLPAGPAAESGRAQGAPPDSPTSRRSEGGVDESPDGTVADVVGRHVLTELAEMARGLAAELCEAGWSSASGSVNKLALCPPSLDYRLQEAANELCDPARARAAAVWLGWQQSDAMLDILVELDSLLPGDGEDGPVPAERPGPEELTGKVRVLRAQLLSYLARYGGYRILEVQPRQSPRDWEGELEFAGQALGSRLPRNWIACVQGPGYFWERDGKRRLVKKARVKLS
jgi:hypothetical protein